MCSSRQEQEHELCELVAQLALFCLPARLALSKPRSNEDVTCAQRLQRPAWEGFLVLSLALPSQKEMLQTPPVF